MHAANTIHNLYAHYPAPRKIMRIFSELVTKRNVKERVTD